MLSHFLTLPSLALSVFFFLLSVCIVGLGLDCSLFLEEVMHYSQRKHIFQWLEAFEKEGRLCLCVCVFEFSLKLDEAECPGTAVFV